MRQPTCRQPLHCFAWDIVLIGAPGRARLICPDLEPRSGQIGLTDTWTDQANYLTDLSRLRALDPWDLPCVMQLVDLYTP